MTPITLSKPAAVQCATITFRQDGEAGPQWLYVSAHRASQPLTLHLQTAGWTMSADDLTAALCRLQDILDPIIPTPESP